MHSADICVSVIAVVLGLYWGWRAYLHHRYPVDRDFSE